MKKDLKIFIEHILESIQLIVKYSKPLTAEKFNTEHAIQDAIIRRLEIIGEAVKKPPCSIKRQAPGNTLEANGRHARYLNP